MTQTIGSGVNARHHDRLARCLRRGDITIAAHTPPQEKRSHEAESGKQTSGHMLSNH
jgi:hypothetical protein